MAKLAVVTLHEAIREFIFVVCVEYFQSSSLGKVCCPYLNNSTTFIIDSDLNRIDFTAFFEIQIL